MIRILAVGNSFTENATFYLHQTAAAAGIQTRVVNLNIGGCSLERHWQNIETDAVAYRYELNGDYSQFNQEHPVSLRSVIQAEPWDIIVFHQASRDSGLIDSYHPYVKAVYAYLQSQAPQAKIFMQETWAYEIDSQHTAFPRYHNDQLQMYTQLRTCYRQVATEIQVPLIPTGDIVQALRKQPPFDYQNGGMSLCEDGHHLSALYGKYLAALVWVKYILDAQVADNTYVPINRYCPERVADPEILSMIRQFVAAYPLGGQA